MKKINGFISKVVLLTSFASLAFAANTDIQDISHKNIFINGKMKYKTKMWNWGDGDYVIRGGIKKNKHGVKVYVFYWARQCKEVKFSVSCKKILTQDQFLADLRKKRTKK